MITTYEFDERALSLRTLYSTESEYCIDTIIFLSLTFRPVAC
jgi:hypothetical protein